MAYVGGELPGQIFALRLESARTGPARDGPAATPICCFAPLTPAAARRIECDCCVTAALRGWRRVFLVAVLRARSGSRCWRARWCKTPTGCCLDEFYNGLDADFRRRSTACSRPRAGEDSHGSRPRIAPSMCRAARAASSSCRAAASARSSSCGARIPRAWHRRRGRNAVAAAQAAAAPHASGATHAAGAAHASVAANGAACAGEALRRDAGAADRRRFVRRVSAGAARRSIGSCGTASIGRYSAPTARAKPVS